MQGHTTCSFAMRLTKRYIWLVLPALLAVIVLSGFLQPEDTGLPAIPELALDNFSQPVREQILAAEAQLRAAPRDAQHNLQLGKILQAYKLLPSAIRVYQRARRLAPEDYVPAYLLGIAQALSGDDAGARTNLQAALALNSAYSPARLRLGEILFKGGELTQAHALLDELLIQKPDSAWAHHTLAQVLTAGDDRTGAMRHNRRAVELYPAFGPAHYALALAYRNSGEVKQAEAHMAAYRRHPDQTPPHDDPLLASLDALDISAQAHVRRAKQLQAAGQLQEALQTLQQAIATEPQSLEAHSQLIRVYHQLNDIDGAERHYRAATTIEPNAVMANLDYGSLLAEQDRVAEAADAFNKALIANPDHSPALTLLGQALEEQQQTAAAEQHYRRALASDPNNQRAGLLLGRLLMLSDRQAEATPYLERAAQGSDSDRAFYLQRIAQVYREAGKHEQALAWMEQARAQAEAQGQQQLLSQIMHTLLRWQDPS